MHSLRETFDNHEYIVYGVNADMLRWASRSNLAQKVLRPAGVSDELLFKAFGAKTHAARVQHSKDIINRLWTKHPALGPYPFLEPLSEFEFARKFYPNYRDHVCHQSKVFLLGLFAYDNCPALQAALDRSLSHYADPQAEFLLRWLVTAVYHDVGYVLESDEALSGRGDAWVKTKLAFNQTLDAPLSALPDFGSLIPRTNEQRIATRNEIFRHSIDVPEDLEFYKKKDLFELLNEEAYRADLGPRPSPTYTHSKSPVRSYYEYAFSYGPLGRDRFRDHGVVSALLLLNTWRAFETYINLLTEKASGEPIIQPHFSKLNTLAKSLSETNETIRSAAAAMALHNINGKIWSPEDINSAASRDLTLTLFRIHLTTPNKENPLAFLLGLVDTLQDWDRPRFRALHDGERPPLEDQDISITAKSGKLLLHFPSDANDFKHPASIQTSRYSKAVSAMKEYLQPEAVDQLVGWTDSPVDMSVEPVDPTPDPKKVEPPPSSTEAASTANPQESPPLLALPIADLLTSAHQAHGKAKLFLLGTEYIRSAKRRVALVAKTPIPIVGTRPYNGTGAPTFYEEEQYNEYRRIILERVRTEEIEFRCIGSVAALREDLRTVRTPQFTQRVLDNLIAYEGIQQRLKPRCVFRWTQEAAPMTFVVADDRFIIWWKGKKHEENVCLAAESKLLADALFESTETASISKPLNDLFQDLDIGISPPHPLSSSGS